MVETLTSDKNFVLSLQKPRRHKVKQPQRHEHRNRTRILPLPTLRH